MICRAPNVELELLDNESKNTTTIIRTIQIIELDQILLYIVIRDLTNQATQITTSTDR